MAHRAPPKTAIITEANVRVILNKNSSPVAVHRGQDRRTLKAMISTLNRASREKSRANLKEKDNV